MGRFRINPGDRLKPLLRPIEAKEGEKMPKEKPIESTDNADEELDYTGRPLGHVDPAK